MTLTAWLRVLFLTLFIGGLFGVGIATDSLKFDAAAAAVTAFVFWAIGAIFGLEVAGEIDRESERVSRREHEEEKHA